MNILTLKLTNVVGTYQVAESLNTYFKSYVLTSLSSYTALTSESYNAAPLVLDVMSALVYPCRPSTQIYKTEGNPSPLHPDITYSMFLKTI
jgi:hypothetical protein